MYKKLSESHVQISQYLCWFYTIDMSPINSHKDSPNKTCVAFLKGCNGLQLLGGSLCEILLHFHHQGLAWVVCFFGGVVWCCLFVWDVCSLLIFLKSVSVFWVVFSVFSLFMFVSFLFVDCFFFQISNSDRLSVKQNGWRYDCSHHALDWNTYKNIPKIFNETDWNSTFGQKMRKAPQFHRHISLFARGHRGFSRFLVLKSHPSWTNNNIVGWFVIHFSWWNLLKWHIHTILMYVEIISYNINSYHMIILMIILTMTTNLRMS